MKLLFLALSFSVAAMAQQPNFREQLRLFRDVKDTNFEVPEELTAPGFETACWSQHSLWKRIQLIDSGGEGQGPGLLKFVAFYQRTDSDRCRGLPKFATFEQTFHQDGPYTAVWRLTGEPESGNTFTFHSRWSFRGHPEVNVYREQCRFFARSEDEKYLVCRVINVKLENGEQTPGFVAFLTYENVANNL